MAGWDQRTSATNFDVYMQTSVIVCRFRQPTLLRKSMQTLDLPLWVLVSSSTATAAHVFQQLRDNNLGTFYHFNLLLWDFSRYYGVSRHYNNVSEFSLRFLLSPSLVSICAIYTSKCVFGKSISWNSASSGDGLQWVFWYKVSPPMSSRIFCFFFGKLWVFLAANNLSF